MRLDPDESSAVARVAAVLARRAGLRLPEARRERLAEILDARFGGDGAAVQRFAGGLDGDGPRARAARDELVGELVSGETYFFRDPGQCDVVENVILPAIVEANHATRRVRVWSAGCSTGEEVYTLAILLDRLRKRMGDPRWRFEAIGTDISRAALAAAARGVYHDWSVRAEVPPADLVPRVAGRFVVGEALRSLASFVRHDLLNDPLPDARLGLADCDLIVCRNVTIYFDDASTRAVERRLTEALAPGGFLVLGHAEVSLASLDLRRRSVGAISYFQSEPARRSNVLASAGATLTPVAPGPARTPHTEALAGAAARAARIESARTQDDGASRAPRGIALRPAASRPTPSAGTAGDSGTGEGALVALAERAADRGDLAEAVRLCELAIERAPVDHAAYSLLGLLRRESGDARGALEAFRHALFLDPNDSVAARELALLRPRRGLTSGHRERGQR